jgi:putative hemolysin
VLDQVLDGHEVDLPALAEPALFVPEATTLMTLLEQIKRTSLPAALVVDEFGQVDGIVSLTDVISAIVGELPVDGDAQPEIVQRDDGSWLLDGALELTVVIRTLEDESIITATDRQHYHTLGGLAMAALGRVPRTGDVFERGRYRFEIVDMDGNRVDRLLVNPIEAEGGQRQSSEGAAD